MTQFNGQYQKVAAFGLVFMDFTISYVLKGQLNMKKIVTVFANFVGGFALI